MVAAQPQHRLAAPTADLTPAIIARAIAARLHKLGVPEHIETRMHERIAVLDAREAAMKAARKSPQVTARPGSAAAVRTTPAPVCLKAAAPWPASAATT